MVWKSCSQGEVDPRGRLHVYYSWASWRLSWCWVTSQFQPLLVHFAPSIDDVLSLWLTCRSSERRHFSFSVFLPLVSQLWWEADCVQFLFVVTVKDFGTWSELQSSDSSKRVQCFQQLLLKKAPECKLITRLWRLNIFQLIIVKMMSWDAIAGTWDTWKQLNNKGLWSQHQAGSLSLCLQPLKRDENLFVAPQSSVSEQLWCLSSPGGQSQSDQWWTAGSSFSQELLFLKVP